MAAQKTSRRVQTPGSAERAPPSGDTAASAPAAAPTDLASATRENPLRPEASVEEVENRIGDPSTEPPRLDALKLPAGF